jgi:hypothetical protein
MVFVSYWSLTAFGPRRPTLGFTTEERLEWDALMRKKTGSYFAVASVVGTLVGLANPVMFFILNSKLFGWVIFITSITIFAGYYFTNWVTGKVLKDKRIKHLLSQVDQTGAVVASVFWKPHSPHAQWTSALVKYVSLANISAVIWLEFSVFTSLTRTLIGVDSVLVASVVMSVSAAVVVFFTLQYGLRGFVFLDAIQSPVMLFAIVVLLGGAMYAVFQQPSIPSLATILTPDVPRLALLIFAIHVTFLNLFLVLVTEPHWLRLWTFGDKETLLQAKSVGVTAVVWVFLVLIGFSTWALTGTAGEPALPALLGRLASLSPAFVVLFWFAAVAAIFSTADCQIYSWLLVNSFNSDTGTVVPPSISKTYAATRAFAGGLVLGVIYFAVQSLHLEFEKVLFVLVPFSLNILPAFAAWSVGASPSLGVMCISLVGYAAVAGRGFVEPARSFDITLAAAYVPIGLSLLVVLYGLGRRKLSGRQPPSAVEAGL